VTLDEAIRISRAAYGEDDGEREAILDALAPVLLGDERLLARAIRAAWDHYPDDLRAVLREYQAERARIDARIGADEDVIPGR
jgi:hypothetical protein